MCLCSIVSKEKWNAVMVARSRFAVHRFKSTRSFTSTHGSILRDHNINKSSFFTSALCLQLSPKCASKDQTFTSVAAWIAVGCFFSQIAYRLLALLIRDRVNRAVFLWLISLDVCFACSLITGVGLLLFMSCHHCMDHLAKHTNIYVPTRMHVSLLECVLDRLGHHEDLVRQKRLCARGNRTGTHQADPRELFWFCFRAWKIRVQSTLKFPLTSPHSIGGLQCPQRKHQWDNVSSVLVACCMCSVSSRSIPLIRAIKTSLMCRIRFKAKGGHQFQTTEIVAQARSYGVLENIVCPPCPPVSVLNE